jgi:nucleoside-triphosphatase THEP1
MVSSKTIAQNILVCGIPGSGKTTYCRWLEKDNASSRSLLLISFQRKVKEKVVGFDISRPLAAKLRSKPRRGQQFR